MRAERGFGDRFLIGLVCARCTRGAQGSGLRPCGRSESLFPSHLVSLFWGRGVRWLWAVLPERGMVECLDESLIIKLLKLARRVFIFWSLFVAMDSVEGLLRDVSNAFGHALPTPSTCLPGAGLSNLPASSGSHPQGVEV
jgi:hypothetical protein